MKIYTIDSTYFKVESWHYLNIFRNIVLEHVFMAHLHSFKPNLSHIATKFGYLLYNNRYIHSIMESACIDASSNYVVFFIPGISYKDRYVEHRWRKQVFLSNFSWTYKELLFLFHSWNRYRKRIHFVIIFFILQVLHGL